MCVEPGKMCMHDMMSLDAAGGAGIAGIGNLREVTYDKFAARGTVDAARWSIRYVAAWCSSPVMPGGRPDAPPVDPEMLKGEGLPVPDRKRGGEGKSVSDRGDPGGRRIIKKKK